MMPTAVDPLRWIVPLIVGVFLLKLALAPAEHRDDRLEQRVHATASGQPDASGRVRPLLVHAADDRWYQPLAVYPTALLLRAGVPEPAAARLPAVAAAAACALLTYLLALRLLQTRRSGAIATLFLVTSPAWLLGAAVGAEFIMAAAILGWLALVLTWGEPPGLRTVVTSGMVLGVSAWTQPAGVLAVPLFLAIGWLLLTERQRTWRVGLAAAFGAAVPLIVCGIWLARHPDAYADTFGRWAIHAAHVRNPWDGLIAVTKWDVVARRAGLYWSYLNPTFLFDGRALFTAGMAAFVAAGLWACGAGGRATALAIGFFAVPLVAALLDAPPHASAVVMMAPLGAVLAACGVEWMLQQRGGRPAVFLLLLIVFVSGLMVNLST